MFIFAFDTVNDSNNTITNGGASHDIATQLSVALADSRPTLVEFYSDTCSRCAEMMPVVKELKAKMGDKAHILQIEGNANSELRTKYHVHSCPTWILFKDGQECWRDGGVKPLSELEDMINRFV